MNRLRYCILAALTLGVLGLTSQSRAEPISEKHQAHIDKGLEWLKRTQHKDGSWSTGGQNPVSMTAMAGLALLMEGSTITQGKYAANIRAAADFCMSRSQKGVQRNGLIGNPDNQGEAGRYMYGHGFAMLFLASVYGEEEDKERRDKLKDILARSVTYCANAQSTQGGWFYTSAKEGHDSDEGSVTVTQMQGLRACKDAGIPVPKDIFKKGGDYLRKSTTQRGGIVYSLGRGGGGAPAGGERPALTAAAIACMFSAGEYKDEYVKKWLKYCETAIPITGPGGGRAGHDEYTQFYYAPAIYFLGEDGWSKMFGGEKGSGLTWSKYRKGFFDAACNSQSADGSWGGSGSWGAGPIYSTSVYLCILQLDNNCLPVFQR
jgi:hypothetical protein